MKQSNTTTNSLFSKSRKRLISSAVILGVLNTVTLPVQAAIQQNQQEKKANIESTHQSSWEQLTELTAQHRLTVSGLKIGRSIHKSAWYENAWGKVTGLFTDDSETIAERADALNTVDQILALRLKTMQEQTAVMQEIAAQTNQLKSQHISPEIMQRQAALVKQLDNRFQTLQSLLGQLQQAKLSGDTDRQQEALGALDKQIQAWQPKPAQTDMQRLPWGSPDSKVRAPITADTKSQIKPAAYSKGLHDLSTTTNQQDRNSSIGQWRSTEYQYSQYLQKQQPIRPIANTQSGMTASGDWPVLSSLPVTVQDADLQANEDVSISPEIKALAKQLNYNPAKIYKWVYDNIEYIPTYGSIQGAAYTLETKRGNSFDTSSLLIALLRTSKIPSRYVYGTIEVPANTVKDWVGGVNSVDAAQNLMGQGGIPNIGLTNGSQVTHVRMEHMWVEAAVDTLPSRGSLNQLDQDGNVVNADASHQWIPLDASYKRYNRTAGIDLAKAVPFDANKLLNDIKTGATIDEATGSVQNIDQNKIDSAISNYNNQVKNYLEQNYSNATVGDILGKIEIRPYQSKMLSPVLPYKVNTVIADYQTLPDSMRHYFVLNTFPSNEPYAQMEGISDFSIKIPSTQLQGKPLAFSFRPSTQADIDLLASYLPKPDASGNIDPSKLPKSLPSSIRMTAEVTLGGQILKVGQSYPLGTEINAQMGFESPNKDWGLPNKQFQAGEYHAIGYDMQGISSDSLDSLQIKLSQTKSAIESKDKVLLSKLSRHDFSGALLQYVVDSYFSLNDIETNLMPISSSVVSLPYMSFGTFSNNIQGIYSWGILRQAKFTGMMMDIDSYRTISVEKNNNLPKLKDFIKQLGIKQSINENQVPEMILRDSKASKTTQGISAVKALLIASQQGQNIYQIDQSNLNAILPRITHSKDTIQDVQNAVASGKVVTISQTKVQLDAWSGSGYIITDPVTGAGAYMIGGGSDGGFTSISDSHGNTFSLAAVVPSLNFLESETLAKSLAYTKNVYEIYIDQTQAYLECNKEVILSFVTTIAIVLAILAVAAATVATGGLDAPATVPIMVVLAAMIPATANAGKGSSSENENCVSDSCKTAQKVHLKAINVLGVEHQYKDSYSATPNRLYDICACNKGAITIAEGAGQCGKVVSFFAITYERWKDPILPWDGN